MKKIIHSICVDSRFRGPSHSANGGYISGLISSFLGGCSEVSLIKPIPLNKQLKLEQSLEECILFNDQEMLAIARPTVVDLEVPPPPMMIEAASASSNYIDSESHYLPECFVCGPDRLPKDGLRIFAGPHITGKYAATVWTPPHEFSCDQGFIQPEIVWAALDCPSYFGLMKPGLLALLGQLSVEISRLPSASQAHTITSWPLKQVGRKHLSGVALHDALGRCIAKGKAVWVELNDAQKALVLKKGSL